MDYNEDLQKHETELARLTDELALRDQIKLSDLPDENLHLYIEQIITILDSKLGPFKRDKDDKILTKTMINNYTKAGLLPRPENKKYSRYHLILLILIYNLKNVLAINDIHSLFKPILKNIDNKNDDLISLEDIYSLFTELKEDEYEEFTSTFSNQFKNIREKTSEITSEDSQDLAELFLTVIMLVAQANAAKRMAEKIIDNYFKTAKEE